MNFTLTDEQCAFQTSAASFAKEKILPFVSQWDEQSFFPMDVLREAAQLGFAGICIKHDVGGSQLSRLDSALIFEELATACVSLSAYLSVQNMVGWLIDHYGNETLRQTWLPKIVSMEIFTSYCLTEPNAGSDAASLKTTAERDGDYYILNGTKAFVSGGSASDLYACMVRTQDTGSKGISCLLVENNTPGLTFGKKEKKMGWRNQPTTSLFFENCRVPISNRIGEEGQGFHIALSALNGGRINIAACALGGAKMCLKLARDYLLERKQFNKKLAEFQGLQFTFADLLTSLESARLMIHYAADAFDREDSRTPVYAAMAKRLATDNSFQIADRAMQLFGGYGYITEYPIERYFRDIRVTQILEGTNEMMRLIIAKAGLNEMHLID